MKAKKVYEFINPKTDEYDLEDTLPLGPLALKIKEIENILVNDEINLSDLKISFLDGILYLKILTPNIYRKRISRLFKVVIIENSIGDKSWFKNNKLHNEDGPAFEYFLTKSKRWYINGKRHREDGPAIKVGKMNYWFLNDEEFTEDEYNKIINKNL